MYCGIIDQGQNFYVPFNPNPPNTENFQANEKDFYGKGPIYRPLSAFSLKLCIRGSTLQNKL